MFGDHDPEDAYDAGDPPGVRLLVLARVVTDLELDPDPARSARRRRAVVARLRIAADQVAAGG